MSSGILITLIICATIIILFGMIAAIGVTLSRKENPRRGATIGESGNTGYYGKRQQ